MSDKKCLIKPEDIKPLVSDSRGCVASNTIIVDGLKIGFMYRDYPDEDIENDSGWRFLSGTEDDDYLDDIENSQVMDINTVANYDPSIIPYLKNSRGIELERIEGTDKFRKLEE